jgi:uncharacterized protein (TIGR02231 family)
MGDIHHEHKSEVAKVTVYTDRAMVTRTVSAQLSPGEQVLRIGNLPANIQEETVRVAGRGGSPVKILDFKLREISFRDLPEKKLQALAEGRVLLENESKSVQDKLNGIEQQKAFVKSVSIASSNKISKDLNFHAPAVDDWKTVLGFIGEQLQLFDDSRRALEIEMDRIQAEIRLIDEQLKRFSGSNSRKRKEAHVDLSVSAEGVFEFEVSYLEYNAKWSPSYDVRVDSEKKKVTVRYFGMVSQNTGEEWTGIKVQLSTARPYLAGDPPRLHPWYVDILRSAPAPKGGPYRTGAKAMPEFEEAPALGGAGKPMMMQAALEEAKYEGADVSTSDGVSVVFSTRGLGDVPGDGSNSKLLIMENEFGSEFRFLAIPKLSQHVYLTTKVENTTDYPLLPGKLSLFLDGNFVGNSNLEELVTPEERFTLNLGVDESIRVKHKLLKKKGDEKGIWTKSKLQEFAYLITLESHRKAPETVIVRDQLPVSQDEKIKVDLDLLHPPENPEKDKDKLAAGVLEWKVLLPPRESARIEFGFTVSYPKDVMIEGV